MHPGLCIPEIVHRIFLELRTLYPKPASDKTLASLAVTCRDFLDPALDMLWSEQTTLRHVLRCLPPHLWEQSVGSEPWDEGQFFLRIIGPVQPEDWTIPLFYANRIQKLTLDCTDTFDDGFPDASVLEAIRAGLPRAYLCPNLRTLLWRSDEDAHLPFLNLFLSPSLEDAAIMLFGLAPPVPLDLNIRSLKKFDLQFPGTASVVCRTTSSLVLHLHQIQELAVINVDHGALQHLSQLDSLRSLELYRMEPELFGRGSSLESRQTAFRSLRAVKLGDLPHSGVSRIFEILPPSCGLNSFTARIEFHNPTMFEEVYTLLAQSLSHAALQTLDIGFFPQNQSSPTWFQSGRDLVPLFAFHNLTYLRVYSPVLLEIDDALAWDMARTWPNLESLLLHSPMDYHLRDSTPVMTLSGLLAFAVHCPRLTKVRIDVDASQVPADALDGTPISSFLAVLDVASSPIGDPDAVGFFVSKVFPRLEKIECLHPGTTAPTHYLGWKQVEALLPEPGNTEEDEEAWELVDLPG